MGMDGAERIRNEAVVTKFKIPSEHLRGRTDENTKTPRLVGLEPNFELTHPEYETGASNLGVR